MERKASDGILGARLVGAGHYERISVGIGTAPQKTYWEINPGEQIARHLRERFHLHCRRNRAAWTPPIQ